ncbi:MEDS domain-containing protein [Paenibacillus sp. tmac-D7]|uniref:MEDS domain-containing protein n=1 Tax=Paenibacillus sp. tmac-D7 TaxID=2591462 RepID=UPI0011441FB7|nr:MEDS domain-containing protein [Paenibacillus sp. tmac-D7]
MTRQSSIPLTSKFHVQNGSHILYFYNDTEKYISNAVSFIIMGINLDQRVIIIDTSDHFERMTESLRKEVTDERIRQYVHYINQTEFYDMHEDFHFSRILLNLNQIIAPYLEDQVDMRLWGQVGWKEQPDMPEKIHAYEHGCDISLSGLGFVTVCGYDASNVNAAVLLEAMKTHPYLMTDDKLVLSSLYNHKSNHAVTYPALAVQKEMESEMDLYRQKLDFVHVVSHEVRNPLTVIKAYSSLLMSKVQDQEDRDKLKAIRDYVALIDNEISHIISTEQMLTTDALWRRRLTVPKELLLDVMEIMEVKARTQNIALHHEIRLNGRETLLSNATGFKLIVSNIISNAIKYSDEGKPVDFKAYRETGQLVLVTQDYGVGMTDNQLSRLFQKYEKTNEQRGGQGIGLFMVKQLVEHHHGDITVESRLDEGTKVTVRLPMQG